MILTEIKVLQNMTVLFSYNELHYTPYYTLGINGASKVKEFSFIAFDERRSFFSILFDLFLRIIVLMPLINNFKLCFSQTVNSFII